MEINNSRQLNKVTFGGYQHKKTEIGTQAYHFNAMYDTNKYDCEVQFFDVAKDKNGNLYVKRGVNGSVEPIYTKSVPEGGVLVEPDYDLELGDKEPFAFRMVLKEKNKDRIVEYLREDSCNDEGFTIVPRTGPSVTLQGPMYLAIADTFAQGYTYAGFKDKNTGEVIEPNYEAKKKIHARINNTNRTFGTVAGGTMAGLEAKIPELADSGYRRLITTPLQGGATASADKYWNENNFLTAGGIGNRNNIASLQRKAFQYGMNTVDDGTFTSEGLQGIHFQRAIKWMDNEELPDEFYYFRMTGLKDGALNLGIVPKNFENLTCKLVNAPFDLVLKKDGTYDMPPNKDYDPERPVEIQVFDRSMASEEQIKDKTHIFTSYDKPTPDGNKLAINTHDDTVIPYHFTVNPEELKKNINNLNEVNKSRAKDERIKYDSPRGTMFIGTLSGLKIGPKTEGGFVCWNAYTDMAKLNYFTSNYDTELLAEIKDPNERAIEYSNLRRANCQLRDMACQVARYRTANVRKNLTEYTAKTIGEIPSNSTKAYDKVYKLIDTQNPNKPKLPYDIIPDQDVVRNVLEDNYVFRPKHENYNDALLSSLMELPLDSIEFSQEVQGALSSPYLSKLSPDEDHITESRFDAMNDPSYKVPEKYAKTYNKMNEVFKNDIKNFADKVLKEVDKNSKEKLFDSDGNMTEYGKYLIPLVGQDIARYAVTKALMPSAKAKIIQGGEIAYDYDDMTERGTLAHMNINGDSQKDEANQLVNRLQKGVNRLMNDNVKFVAESINKRFANTNTNTLKLAEVMVDRSGYGLDWRFDAAKDVADIDSVNNANQTINTALKNNIRFWGDMVKVINDENSNSYTVAEVTNMDNYFTDSLVNLAGITSEANYSYFFDGISSMFGYDYVTGKDNVDDSDSRRIEKLEQNLESFARRGLDYKRNSYTFASNHDKPRMIHCLSMDMSLFHCDLNDSSKSNEEHRKVAYMMMCDKMGDSLKEDDWKIIKGETEKNFFKNVSPKSIANAELLRGSIGIVKENVKDDEIKELAKTVSGEQYEFEKNKIVKRYEELYVYMSKAVADIVNGNYYKNTSPNSASKEAADPYKKVLEKDGFGTKPVGDAFDIIYDQANYIKDQERIAHVKDFLQDKTDVLKKNGISDDVQDMEVLKKVLNDTKKTDKLKNIFKDNQDLFEKKELLNEKELQDYRNRVDSKATEVGRAKTRIIMRYLAALSGNPTLYAGDEYGMTGYEDPCQNTYLQNRPPIDHLQAEIIKDDNDQNINEYFRQDIYDYKESLADIFRARRGDEMNFTESMNNGTMYKLNKQHSKDTGLDCSAVMYQASNGSMNISVFNPNGISTSPKKSVDELHPRTLSLDSIALSSPRTLISLTPGTVFKNVNPEDDSTYKVHEFEGNYFIKLDNGTTEGAKIVMNEKTAPDGVMMLYHLPDNIEKMRSELKEHRKEIREYYNTVHNIPNAAAYSDINRSGDERGQNIDLTSKD